ncbi:hypothetical protein EV359DRAFT_64026 [Lentinula novae-zelandiae]|nr:hypothetical protein EV359DRAFT_64026 [Lentinula novae-zelandiae]
MTSNPSGTAVSGDILQIFNDYSAVKYTNEIQFLEMPKDWLPEISASLPWKLPKFLFVINRYIVPPMLFFDGILSMLSWFPASIVVAARTTVCEKVPGTSGTNIFTGCIFNAHGIVWPTWIPPVIVETYKVLVQVERIPTITFGQFVHFQIWPGFPRPSTIVACISTFAINAQLQILYMQLDQVDEVWANDWQVDRHQPPNL